MGVAWVAVAVASAVPVEEAAAVAVAVLVVVSVVAGVAGFSVVEVLGARTGELSPALLVEVGSDWALLSLSFDPPARKTIARMTAIAAAPART